jgi:hypothetical protein
MDESFNLLEKMHRISGALDAYNTVLKLSQIEGLTMFELRMKIYDLTNNLFNTEKDENENPKI